MPRRRQAGQAVVLVAVSVLVLTGILAITLDGGGIYLTRRQLQNAADAAALAGAELLMAVPPDYGKVHDAAVGMLLKNLPGTTMPAICSTPSCPNQKTVGWFPPPPANSNQVMLNANTWIKLTVTAAYTYQVSIWQLHSVAVAPVHGFASTIMMWVYATAQNANLPYAITVLQDQALYASYSNLKVGGSIRFQGGGGGADRGGAFSNESIQASTSLPSITFNPCAATGDLWAVSESGTDATRMTSPYVTCGQNQVGTYPRQGTHLDYPAYPEPPALNASPYVYSLGVTVSAGTLYLCPGTYQDRITIAAGTTGVLLPGIFRVTHDGVTVSGTLRTLQAGVDPASIAAGQTNCGVGLGSWADPGVIIELAPVDDTSIGSTNCSAVQFTAGVGATVNLAASATYFNTSLFVETMTNWQNVCTSAPLGTNVISFLNSTCLTIPGAIIGPFDNMTISQGGCGSGVGQIVAWTLTQTGSTPLIVTFNPNLTPYQKGLTQ